MPLPLPETVADFPLPRLLTLVATAAAGAAADPLSLLPDDSVVPVTDDGVEDFDLPPPRLLFSEPASGDAAVSAVPLLLLPAEATFPLLLEDSEDLLPPRLLTLVAAAGAGVAAAGLSPVPVASAFAPDFAFARLRMEAALVLAGSAAAVFAGSAAAVFAGSAAALAFGAATPLGSGSAARSLNSIDVGVHMLSGLGMRCSIRAGVRALTMASMGEGVGRARVEAMRREAMRVVERVGRCILGLFCWC